MIHLLLQAGGAEDKLDIVSLIVHASSVAKGTLMLLALMSIVSWFVSLSGAATGGRGRKPRVFGVIAPDCSGGPLA